MIEEAFAIASALDAQSLRLWPRRMKKGFWPIDRNQA